MNLALAIVASLTMKTTIPAPKVAPTPAYELAVNETAGATLIDGKAYDCVTTDFGGRYDTTCTPRGE
jgi:hypothetical protein